MISSFLFLLKKIKSELIPLFLISFIIPILTVVVSPLAIKILINRGLTNKNLQVVGLAIAALVLSSIFSVILRYFLNLRMKVASISFLKRFVPSAIENYYKLDYQNIISKGEGYYLSRVYDEPREIAEGFIPIVVNTFRNCLTLIFGLAVAIYIAWEVTIVLLLLVPLLHWLTRKFNKRIKEVVNIETEQEANLRETVSKSLQAFKTTLLYNLEKKVTEVVSHQLSTFTKASYNSRRMTSRFTMFTSSFFATSQVLVIVLASLAIFIGRLTIGGMMGYLNAYGRILMAVNGLASNLPNFSKYQKYIERLNEIINISENEKIKIPVSKDNNILLKNVSFRYDGIQIFNNFNLSITPNSNVLIEGDNGSGKTTLANILAGFIPIDEGKIQLPESNSISGLIEPYHFIPGTVKQNLSLDQIKDYKREEILFLLERHGIKDKLNQSVFKLSYGQKKKLYLILAMTSHSNIYIYDEPLKGIDKESITYIFDDLFSYAKDSTFIMISHSNVDKAYFDQVIELKNRV